MYRKSVGMFTIQVNLGWLWSPGLKSMTTTQAGATHGQEPFKCLLFSFRLKFLYCRLKHRVLFGRVVIHLCTPSTFTYFSYLSISVFIFPNFVIQPFPSSKTCSWFPMWHATKSLVCQQHYIPSGKINTSLSPVLHRITQCYWKCQLGVGHKIYSVK